MNLSFEQPRDRAIGALIGLAVGDAVGTTLEFSSRDTYEPLTDMVGGGPFRLEPGQWTDDTAMALCLADSLLAHDDLDLHDLMARFTNWRQYGANSCTGTCFDIGNTVRAALDRFERTGNPLAGSTDPYSAGNGSLMRLSPVAARWHRQSDRAEAAAREQSRTTHGTGACLEACALFARLLVEAINGAPKADILAPRRWHPDSSIDRIASGSFLEKSRSEIRGSGYVVDALEASLWSVANADNYRDAVLLAANLGDDADTTAAITGQLAGAIWGRSGIPQAWLERLAWANRIEEKAIALFDKGSAEG